MMNSATRFPKIHCPVHGKSNGRVVRQHQVSSVAFSPDGSVLAIGGGVGPRALTLLDVTADRPVRRDFEGLPHYVSSLDYSPDGRLLGAASTTPEFCLAWDVASGRRVFAAEARQGSYGVQVRFAADGRLVSWCPERGRLQWWDVA